MRLLCRGSKVKAEPMLWAQIQDAMAIWDGSPRPCDSIWLRIKASICIALGREVRVMNWRDTYIPIWASKPTTVYSYDGPGQDWAEVAVSPEWWRWKFARYTNGF